MSTPGPSFGWRGLTPQLFLFIVLPLTALLIAITLGSLALHGQAMRDLVIERDQRAARAASAAITEQLSQRTAALRGLAIYTTMVSPTQALADYAFLLTQFEGGLALYAPDGTLLAASGALEVWRSRPVDAVLVQTPRDTPSQFSSAFVESGSSAYLVLASAAAADGPIAVGAFSPAGLAQRALVTGPLDSDLPTALLIDASGQVLYRAGLPPTETDLAQHAGVAEALRGESGGTHLMVEGSEHVIAYSPVAPMDWALIIEEPWEQVDNPLLRQTQTAPLILVPVVLFAIIALAFGLRQIVQPLRSLEQKASELAWGRFEAIETPVGGIAEIRHLQAQLVLMAQKVKAAQQGLRGYLSAITAGQEDERRRLARELHDGAVQALVALDQRSQLAQLAVKNGSSKAAEQLAEVRQMTAALIEEVRRVIRALRPIYLEDLGLLPALEMLARDLEATTGARASFSAQGQPRRLSPGHEIAVYRIVQEALNNIARYASARSVLVSATFASDALIIGVQDDGQGFTAPERLSDLIASGHYGLMGMQERAELIGALLSIRSSPGTGATIELRVPLA